MHKAKTLTLILLLFFSLFGIVASIFMHQNLLMIGGIIFFIIVCLLLHRANQEHKTINQNKLEEFKSKADKFLVNIEDHTIKSNSWTEEVEIKQDKYIASYNYLIGNVERNIKKTQKNPNYVYLKLKYLDKEINYDFFIDKEPQTLQVMLGLKKETYLYIDKNDPEKRYLDLEFLGG